MFTVVIPTMWRADELYKTIDTLNNSDIIDEIIIINNNRHKRIDLDKVSLSDKFKIITPHDNLFVGESWNLGVRYAKNELVCLLNDDIILRNDVGFRAVLNYGFKECSIIGLGSWAIVDSLAETNDTITIYESKYMDYGYGVCMFFNKSDYTIIPPELKLSYTDNYLYVMMPKKTGRKALNMVWKLVGRFSTTVCDFRDKFNSKEASEEYRVFCERTGTQ